MQCKSFNVKPPKTETQVNDWLNQNPEIEIKFVSTNSYGVYQRIIIFYEQK